MIKKRIWIVTELFYPEETATAYIFTRIADYLSKDYQIGVICGPEFYDNHKTKFVDNIELSNEIEIYRTKLLNLDKNSLIQRTLKFILLSIRMAFLITKKISKGEIVLLATNPAPLLLFVSFIKFFKRFQLHILVHDVFPENTIPAGIFINEKSFIYKVIKLVFDKAYSSADQLIVIGRDMKEIIYGKVKRFKISPIISIVPNWSNPEKINYTSQLKVKNANITLQYAGNLGRVQGLLGILEAFRLSNNKELVFNIHGTGALQSEIESYLKKYNLKNVFLNGSFSRNEENAILATCDIGIVSLSSGMFGLGVPSKTYHLLSAGKPILFIGEPKTEISCMILENDIGWSLDIRNQKEMINFFKDISSYDLNILHQIGNRSRHLAEIKYNELTTLSLLQTKIESFNKGIILNPGKSNENTDADMNVIWPAKVI